MEAVEKFLKLDETTLWHKCEPDRDMGTFPECRGGTASEGKADSGIESVKHRGAAKFLNSKQED
jgi:hypothetical protein